MTGYRSIRLAAARRSALWFHAVRATDVPREEPGALAAHAGICAGGEEKSYFHDDPQS
jgi:hypothetical protein